MMLHTKYQGSRPCGVRQEDFFRFTYISLYKTYDPGAGPFLTPGRAHFWPQGHHLNKVGKGLLDDASYQVLRL